MTGQRRHAVVFGGAGFIGSHIVRRLADEGMAVSVVDGLLARTGGSLANLQTVRHMIDLYPTRIEDLEKPERLTASADLVVDCMAWTRHLEGTQAPLYDCQLNLQSHLHLLEALKCDPPQRVVYVGSTGQYGRWVNQPLTEHAPMVPLDVQGVHKAAADHHFRIAASTHGLNVVSVRLPNCFGEGQTTTAEDIGLVGGFIRSLLDGEPVIVYGAGRTRSILYAGDAAATIWRLCNVPLHGFVAVNMPGYLVNIRQLATMLVDLIGRGSVADGDVPDAIAQLDVPNSEISGDRLHELVGEPSPTDLATALCRTIAHFRAQSPS